MRRRTFLGVTAVSFVLSGCVGDLTETDTESGDVPETAENGSSNNSTEDEAIDVLERNWDAYKNKRIEEYISTYHSEAPRRETEPWNDEGYWPKANSRFTIEKREVVNQTDTTVIIHEKIRRENDEETSTFWNIVELRKDSNDWKVWNYEYAESEPSSK